MLLRFHAPQAKARKFSKEIATAHKLAKIGREFSLRSRESPPACEFSAAALVAKNPVALYYGIVVFSLLALQQMGQALSSSGDLPVVLGREILRNSTFSLHDGTDNSQNGKSVSVFSLPLESAPSQAFFRRLRALRHPGILTVVHASVVEAKKASFIVTERVVPLRDRISDLDADSILLGVFQVAGALKFLNKDVNLIHGSVNLDTVFVTGAGDWQLGGFEICSPSTDTGPIQKAVAAFSDNLQWPPEVPSVSTALDAWCVRAEPELSP